MKQLELFPDKKRTKGQAMNAASSKYEALYCPNTLSKHDLRSEKWREYVLNPGTDQESVYHIDEPVALFFPKRGTTHRILDANGVVHCVPFGDGIRHTVLRWAPKNPQKPVSF